MTPYSLVGGQAYQRFGIIFWVHLQGLPWPQSQYRLLTTTLTTGVILEASLYSLRTDHTENTAYIVDESCLLLDCIAIDVLLFRAVTSAGTCFSRSCLATRWSNPLFHCCVRVLLSNGCFCGSTVLAWSKYVTISIPITVKTTIFRLFSLFWQKKGGLYDRLAVCVSLCIPPNIPESVTVNCCWS
jgi:hypothetical protein